ncbi:MAG: APC family permease [Actinobacteria bacterium]|nr:APC family permease [Actinomycetota bacterium]
MAIQDIDQSDLITAAALEEKTKLKKHFGRFDIFFFLICAIVGVDTLGQVAASGPQGFLWLIFLCIFFFVPYGLLVAELGSAFPEEGGPYVWTRMAWGRLPAGLNSIFFWFANPVWIGSTLALLVIAALQNYVFQFENGSWVWWTVGLVYIWFSVWSAILSFGVGKWIPTVGAWCRIALVGLFSITTVLYGIQYGLHIPEAGEWSPTWIAFVALVPLLFYNLVGFEQPSAAGDEMTNPQKDVPVSVIRGMLVSILLYGLPILAIIFVLPPADIAGNGVSAFLDAVDTTFKVWGGAQDAMVKVAVVMFILAVVSSASAWLMGSDRAQAMASIDGTGPRSLGHFSSKFGTPITVNVISGVIATLVFAASGVLGGGDAAAAFNVTLGVVLLFTTLSYIIIFPALIKLRKSHPHAPRPYKVPFGMAGVWICGLLTTGWAVFASLFGIFPGLFADGQLLNDDGLPDGVTRGQYESIVFASIAIALVVGVIFYIVGSSTRKDLVIDPEVPLEPAGEMV